MSYKMQSGFQSDDEREVIQKMRAEKAAQSDPRLVASDALDRLGRIAKAQHGVTFQKGYVLAMEANPELYQVAKGGADYIEQNGGDVAFEVAEIKKLGR